MPLLGLGTWKSKSGEVEAAVKKALEVGYRHIDCAFGYGNEGEVGKALKYGMEELKIPRSEIFVTSKLWNTFHAPQDVEPAFHKSLEALGLEYLDLYLMHWPICFKNLNWTTNFPTNPDGSIIYDLENHPNDTYLAMEKLVEKGLVKSIGVSNFNSKQIEDVLSVCKIKPVTNQVECQPYLGQEKLKKFCEERGIFLTAYSPLGSPDRPWAKPDDPKLLEDSRLVSMGQKYGKSVAQILLRWQIQRKIVVIPKSVTPSRIEENAALFDFELSEEDMKVIAGFECNGRIILPMKEGKPRDAGHPHFPFNIEF